MMFLGLRKLGNIYCGHEMFLNKIRNIFLCSGHKTCVRNIVAARAGKRGNIFVGNNVSSFARALTPCVTAVDAANNINMRHCFLTFNTPEKHYD